MHSVNFYEYKDFVAYIQGLSSLRLIQDIAFLEYLLDTDEANDSNFLDFFIALHEFMRNECVARLAKVCNVEYTL